jgi:hypothetical protein
LMGSGTLGLLPFLDWSPPLPSFPPATVLTRLVPTSTAAACWVESGGEAVGWWVRQTQAVWGKPEHTDKGDRL